MGRSFSAVTAPDPHQRIGQGLLENFAVAVPGIQAEYVMVIVTLRLQRRPQLSGIRWTPHGLRREPERRAAFIRTADFTCTST